MRRCLAYLLSWSLLATLLVISQPVVPPAGAVTSTRSTALTVAPAKPWKGVPFVVSGQLSSTVVRTVKLQQYRSKKWRTVKTVTSAADGSFRLTTSSSSASYTLRVVVPAAKVGGVSYGSYTSPRKTVRLGEVRTRSTTPVVSPSKLGRGQPFMVTGQLSTKVVRTVTLQKYSRGKWRTVRTTTSALDGSYRLGDSAASSSYAWRVRVPAATLGGVRYGGYTSKRRTVRTGVVRPGSPMVGETFTVTSKVKTSGARPVQLQTNIGGVWTTIATGRTSKKGSFSLSASTRLPVQALRVVAPKAKVGKKTRKRAVVLSRTIRTSAQVGTLTMPSVAYADTPFTARLIFDPLRVGRVTELQRQVGDQWVTVVSGKQDAVAVSDLRVTLDLRGSQTFRGRALPYAGAAEVFTSPVTVSFAPSSSVPVPSITTDLLSDGTVGTTYAASLTASDGTAPFTWSASGLPAGLILNAATGEISGTPTAAGQSTVAIRVTDANSQADTASLVLVVRAALGVTTSGVPDGSAGEPYSGSVPAAGGVEPYTWSAWGLPESLVIDSATGAISGTPRNAGTFPVFVTITDAQNRSVTSQVDLVIDAGSVSVVPPAIDETGLPDTIAGDDYAQTLHATGGTPPLSWSAYGLPSGLSMDPATGAISGSAPASSESTVFVMVKDAANLTSTKSFAVRVYPAAEQPPAPRITTVGLSAGVVDDAYRVTLAVSGRAPFSWSATGLPDGLSLDSSTGVVSGTPTTTGTSTVHLAVTDKNGNTDSADLDLVVGAAVHLTTDVETGAMEGEVYSQELTAAGGTSPYRWTASGLPDGISVSGHSLTGTPTTAGTYPVTITVTDDHNKTATANVELVVRAALGVDTSGVPDGSAGEPYSGSVPAAGGVEPFTWSAWGLPESLVIDSATGAISGTPRNAGTFPVFVTVADAQNRSVTSRVDLVIDAGSVTAEAPTVTTTGLLDAVKGDAYEQTLTATGGAAPYTWSAYGLPEGLSVAAATGVVSGTPSTTGDSTVFVMVKDAAGLTSTASFAVRVYPAAEQPPAPQITTASLPTGVVDDDYSLTLAASGRAPFSWSATGLPDGLSLNPSTGVISGTPTATGTSTVHLAVTDKNSNTDSADLALVVGAAAHVTTSGVAAGLVGEAYSQDLAAAGGTAPYSWAASGLPDGISVSGAKLVGIPTTAGTYPVTITVTDDHNKTDSVIATLVVGPAVSVTTTTLIAAVVNETYTANLSASGGTAPYSWAASGLPDGITLSGRQLTGVPASAGTSQVSLTVTDDHGKTATVSLQLVVRPVVSISTSAVPDGIVGHTMAGLLEASGGTEPYAWSATGLPAGLTLGEDSGLIEGRPTEGGSFTIEATVTDALGRTDTASYPMQISAATTVTTTALDEGMVGYDYDLTLAAAGGLAPYTWAADTLPDGLSIDQPSGAITGVPTQAGTTSVTITATDDTGQTASEVFDLVIAPGVSVSTSALERAEVGSAYGVDLTAAGGVPGYTWTARGLPDGLTVSAAGRLSGTPTVAGSSIVELTVTDANGKTASVSLSLVVGNAVAPDTQTIAGAIAGTAYATTLVASGGTEPYAWSAQNLPDGLAMDGATGTLSGTPTAVGSYTVTVSVTDANHRSASRDYALVVGPAVAISTTSLPGAVAGTGYSVTPSATGGQAPYSWSATGLPSGLTIEASTGKISGSPAAAGTATVTVTVTDAGNARTSAEFSLEVGPAVSISTTSLPNAVKGTSYAFTLVAAGGTAPYTWSVSGLPSGLTAVAATGVISGTPTVTGSFQLNVLVSDANGKGSFAMLAVAVDPAVSVATSSLASAVVGTAYSATVAASGGTTPYSWSATGLPSGLSLNPSTGAISGTPTTSGTSSVQVTVADANSKTASRTISLVVGAAVSITTSSLPTGVKGTAYSATLVGAGGRAPLSWSATGLPAGLSVAPATGVITGTPSATGTASVSVTVTDADSKTATKALSLVVGAAVSITTATLPHAVKGTAYSQTLAASGGTAPYTWSVSGLPSGLSVNTSTGLISGTATVTGSYQVDVAVTDANSKGSLATLSLTVDPAVSISTTSLTAAAVSSTYTFTLAAVGGTAPYSWAATGLPDGLTVNATTGSISGTPTVEGTSSVQVTVTDANTKTATATLSLIVNPALSVTTTSLDNGTVGLDYYLTLAGTGGQAPYAWSATGLPDGLTINAGSGVISGSPSAGGTSTVVITITDATTATASATLSLVVPDPIEASAAAVGQINACVVTNGGGVECAGLNTEGVLGSGTTAPRSNAMTPVAGLSSGVSAVGVSSANYFACALTTDGGVKCWGYNGYGQLGNGTTTSSTTPVDVNGLTSGVTAISVGDTHVCAITTSGAAKCWGSNSFGALGNASFTGSSTPVSVSNLTSGVTAISAGSGMTCAVVSGAATCWGNNTDGQLGNNSTSLSTVPVLVSGLSSGVTAIAAMSDHACAIVSGAAKCWGRNSNAQLGDGSFTSSKVPVSVSGLSSGVSAVAVTFTSSCALSSDGSVRCWGENSSGQVGDGTTTVTRSTPVAVSGLSSGVTALTTGRNNACATLSSGVVKCWGNNTYGQFGDGGGEAQSIPLSVDQLAGVAASTSAGSVHACALTSGGGVKCWGNNAYGQLGNNTTNSSSTPVTVSGLTSGVTAVTSGGFHSCALTSAGGVKCWGRNTYGQLGDGSTTDRATPVAVSGLSSGVVALTGGMTHTCALTTTGAVKCWGSNAVGEVGDGTTNDRATPVAVSGLSSGVTAMSAGDYHTCALTSAGAVKCWGANNYGALGDGTTSTRTSPVAVSGLSSGVTGIAGTQYSSCALIDDGSVKCWGYNAKGQLGDGTTTSKTSPVAVSGLPSGVTKIEAGDSTVCALTTNGAVSCWGDNSKGQLATGTFVNSSTPATAPRLTSGVVDISVGGSACAVTTTHDLRCWGNNKDGQLGRDTIRVLAPKAVVLT